MSESQIGAGNLIQNLKNLKNSLTLSISHSLTLDILNNFCFHAYAQNTLSHFHTLALLLSHTLALSLSHTLSFSHSLSLGMLNKFGFHVYAQKSLFIAEKCNGFFLTAPSPVTLDVIELVPI